MLPTLLTSNAGKRKASQYQRYQDDLKNSLQANLRRKIQAREALDAGETNATNIPANCFLTVGIRFDSKELFRVEIATDGKPILQIGQALLTYN